MGRARAGFRSQNTNALKHVIQDLARSFQILSGSSPNCNAYMTRSTTLQTVRDSLDRLGIGINITTASSRGGGPKYTTAGEPNGVWT